MLSVFFYFKIAARLAMSKEMERNAVLGAVGIRKDGAMVSAMNGMTKVPEPSRHAEARLCRKLDRGSVVYVARVTKNGEFAMAKPCGSCMALLRAKKVRRVYYTTGPKSYEVMDL